jgi:hypothetical protein
MMNDGKGLRTKLLASVAIGMMAVANVGGGLMPAAEAQGFSSFSASGTVLDSSGRPIPKARVTIRSVDQGFTRTVTTNDNGVYGIPELRQGNYQFTVDADGYDTYVETNIRLAPGSASNQFRLAKAGSSDTAGTDIVVTSKRIATADFDMTTTGQVINVADVAARLPVARDLTSVLLLAPGTASGSGAFGGLASTNGGAVSENAFFVNGLNITDFRKGLSPAGVPFDFYQTIEVKSGGYAAEFGRSTGGFTSATTKSGSNEFHGGLLFSWNPDGLRTRTHDTFYSDNDGGRIESRSTTFQLSGPIIKDHLFFYGLYQARNNTSVTASRQFLGDPRTADVNDPSKYLGTSRTYFGTSSPFYGGKIDAVIVNGQRLEFTYWSTKGDQFFNTYGSAAPGYGRYNYLTNKDGPYAGRTLASYGGENYVGRYTGVFSKWLTVSAAYGRNENNYFSQSFNESNAITPSVSDARNPLAVVPLTRSSGGRSDDNDVRKFYRADADIYFNFLGSHHFKGGYDREELTSVTASRGGGGGLFYTVYTAQTGNPYNLAVGTNYVRRTTYFNEGRFTSLNEAYYLQDSWSLFSDRLTVNLGIRNDRFTNDNALKQTFYKSGNQWGPRLGFTFDPVGDRRDKIYGSFGRLFVPVASNTNIRLTGGETYYTRTALFNGLTNANVPILGNPINYTNAAACPDDGALACSVTGNGQPKSAETTVARQLKPQSADEYILGYEKRLGTRWRVGAYFTYTKLNEVLEDSSIDQAVNAYCVKQKVSGCNAIWDGFHQYVLINPGSASRITLSDPINGETTLRTVDFSAADLGYPKARRTYKGMTFEAHREFDGVWSLDASYTYSKTIGNYEGGVKTDNGQSDTGLTTDFDQPGLTLGTYGYSPNDKRHVIKLAGSYLLFDRLNIGGKLQAYSPRRYGCIGRVPETVDPYSAAYGAAGLFCQVNADGSINTDPTVSRPVQLIPRGSVFKSDWLFVNDLDIGYKFDVGSAAMTLRATVFNVFNRQPKLNLNENGTDGEGKATPYYRTVTQYQDGRSARLQLSFDF